MPHKLTLAHELDIAWIIALWKAIHGGDPTPTEVDVRTAELVEQLTSHLSQTIKHETRQLSVQSLEQRLGEVGIKVEPQAAGGVAHQTEEAHLVQPGDPEGRPQRPIRYCFVFRGTTYCVEFPRHVFTVE